MSNEWSENYKIYISLHKFYGVQPGGGIGLFPIFDITSDLNYISESL